MEEKLLELSVVLTAMAHKFLKVIVIVLAAVLSEDRLNGLNCGDDVHLQTNNSIKGIVQRLKEVKHGL